MANFEYEIEMMQRINAQFICGIDEAGRGPWAGPVVAAAVIFDKNNIPSGLDDSKKLSETKRMALAPLIKQTAIAYSIAFIDAKIIDEINILQATFKAMKTAFLDLTIKADGALIDGNRDPKIGIPTKTIIKGDSLSVSIAAASILAKTARDEYMIKAHKKFPQYGFDKHKGYGVPFHLEALKHHGPCPLHRLSFKPIKNILTAKNESFDSQIDSA